eukprot:TRINITY_DN31016_c0_g1_i1.p1 TRINITY_DN31016_c0_g1~~TRINITY_DN31016_c0_g1_i1.p1  ORF type:complete len:181 (-),score=7.87 TRINITY_DN31016_c0_g1_i1:89-631(-)
MSFSQSLKQTFVRASCRFRRLSAIITVAPSRPRFLSHSKPPPRLVDGYMVYNGRWQSRFATVSVGVDLANQVAEKLKVVGWWGQYEHRDYCGEGLLYNFKTGEFELVEIYDGTPCQTLATWKSQSAFVSWLARQNNWTLAGGDPNVPETAKNLDSFEFANQSITLEALQQFLVTDVKRKM